MVQDPGPGGQPAVACTADLLKNPPTPLLTQKK